MTKSTIKLTFRENSVSSILAKEILMARDRALLKDASMITRDSELLQLAPSMRESSLFSNLYLQVLLISISIAFIKTTLNKEA